MGSGRGGGQERRGRAQQKAEDDQRKLEGERYWVEREEKYLKRMRQGYAEGTKLYFEVLRTQVVVTTGTILVIVALSSGLLVTDAAWKPLLWASYALLLGSMVAGLRTMEQLGINVYTVLVFLEQSPRGLRFERQEASQEAESDKEVEAVEEAEKSLDQMTERSSERLKWRTRVASGSFLLGIVSFLLFVVLPVVLPTSAEILGWPLAVLLLIGAGVLAAVFYRRF